MTALLPATILFLPLLAAAKILLLPKPMKGLAPAVSVGSVVLTLILSLVLWAKTGSDSTTVTLGSWINLGDMLQLNIGLKINALATGMMLVVTFIGTLVHLFSLAYMKDDDGKARYFAGLSLFMFSMTGIVLADNLAMMFIFWELVGVSSYLLIGHWFEKNSAAEAAKKAFLTNRIGDFGFMIGILMLWKATGSVTFDGIESAVRGMTVDPATTAHRADHDGRDYFFCSAGCRTRFIADPDRYLTPGAEAGPVVPGVIYTCPMHPEIRQEGPGSCPICGMALEPETVTAEAPPNH